MLVLKQEHKHRSNVISGYLFGRRMDNFIVSKEHLSRFKDLEKYFEELVISKELFPHIVIGSDNVLYDIGTNAGIPIDALYVLQQLEDNYLHINSINVGGFSLDGYILTTIFKKLEQ
ncbi:MAG TPA: hypothetical protein VKX35_04405 [Fermentimonas sp.]|nr:hypothetical protein [Fermentimonas sp.]